jgi:hypothetical protein
MTRHFINYLNFSLSEVNKKAINKLDPKWVVGFIIRDGKNIREKKHEIIIYEYFELLLMYLRV